MSKPLDCHEYSAHSPQASPLGCTSHVVSQHVIRTSRNIARHTGVYIISIHGVAIVSQHYRISNPMHSNTAHLIHAIQQEDNIILPPAFGVRDNVDLLDTSMQRGGMCAPSSPCTHICLSPPWVYCQVHRQGAEPIQTMVIHLMPPIPLASPCINLKRLHECDNTRASRCPSSRRCAYPVMSWNIGRPGTTANTRCPFIPAALRTHCMAHYRQW